MRPLVRPQMGYWLFLPPLCLAACPKPVGANDSKSANAPFALRQGKGAVRFSM